MCGCRAGQILRDFFDPIHNGTVALQEIKLEQQSTMIVRNGQCQLDDLQLHSFVSKPWWKKFWDNLQGKVNAEAGCSRESKLFLSNLVLDVAIIQEFRNLLPRGCSRGPLGVGQPSSSGIHHCGRAHRGLAHERLHRRAATVRPRPSEGMRGCHEHPTL